MREVMKPLEALNEMCNHCQKLMAVKGYRCTCRSISGDYCIEYEVIKKALKRRKEDKEEAYDWTPVYSILKKEREENGNK